MAAPYALLCEVKNPKRILRRILIILSILGIICAICTLASSGGCFLRIAGGACSESQTAAIFAPSRGSIVLAVLSSVISIVGSLGPLFILETTSVPSAFVYGIFFGTSLLMATLSLGTSAVFGSLAVYVEYLPCSSIDSLPRPNKNVLLECNPDRNYSLRYSFLAISETLTFLGQVVYSILLYHFRVEFLLRSRASEDLNLSTEALIQDRYRAIVDHQATSRNVRLATTSSSNSSSNAQSNLGASLEPGGGGISSSSSTITTTSIL